MTLQAWNSAWDAKARGHPVVDVKELPESYGFIADMPRLQSGDNRISDILRVRVDYCTFFPVIHGLFRVLTGMTWLPIRLYHGPV
ncbi:hypothetical protein R1flu_012350 [Riccia fluitans]|uniref:Uncharacterized protein n=1 Tax=Riccia fluitans TaxID=41844 RepID=A0ABD1ZBI0_9MARC